MPTHDVVACSSLGSFSADSAAARRPGAGARGLGRSGGGSGSNGGGNGTSTVYDREMRNIMQALAAEQRLLARNVQKLLSTNTKMVAKMSKLVSQKGEYREGKESSSSVARKSLSGRILQRK